MHRNHKAKKMNKHLLLKILAIGPLVLSGVFYLFIPSNAMVRNQEIPPTATEQILEQATDTPTPTFTPLYIELRKEYSLTNDINGNNNIDPGDKVTYTITFTNKGSIDVTNLVILDRLPLQYFEVINKGDITKGGTYNGEVIEWDIGILIAGSSDSVGYTVTLKSDLSTGTTEISNPVAVLSEGVTLAETRSIYVITVPTPSPSMTQKPTPSPSLTPLAPTPTTIVPGASILSGSPLPTYIIGGMALIGITVFTLMLFIKIQNGSNNQEDGLQIKISTFREGVIIIFIVSAVLLMGISNTLQPDGVISILSAIVGYVFGRASSTKK
jgi:uncharacterized repeat protein (TIGR01451 family)